MSQEQVEKTLQKNGKRITQQRKILLDVILNGQWECCKEIYYEAVKRDPTIGMATVYRMMTTLEEVGVMERRCVFRVRDEIELPS
ncbi:transcriptional repressor [Anaerostipes sp.]|uniref:transcriptional repressor n=1 Tax=Anaerostipes sp. TaxID=1872530 RepID=UPI003FED6682